MDKRLMGEIHLARLAFVSTVCFSLLGGILTIIQAFLLSRIIVRGFLEQANQSDITQEFVILFVIILLRAANRIAINMTASTVAIHIKHDFRERLVQHLMKLGPSYMQGERSGELSITATDGIEALDNFFRDYLPALFTALLIPLAILIVVFPLDLPTFLILIVTAPLIPIFMILIGIAAGSLAKSQYAQLGQMSAHFLDVMQGLYTLKLFNRSKPQIQTIEKITNQFRLSTMAVLRVAFLSAFVLELLATISVAVVAVEIGLRLLAGNMLFEQALFLLVIAPEFYMPLRELGAKFHSGRDGIAAADRIYDILNTPVQVESGNTILSTVQKIQFERVNYAYADRDNSALDNISFTLERGEHIALVGATGSGKSTVTNLLMRFIQLDSGNIFIDDGQRKHDLKVLDIEAWRKHIAWVPQRSYLFNMSVFDNICIGQDGVSKEHVISAARKSAAHEFIQQLPAGYDTIVGENGIRLSGGQIQRIALARAFLRDVPIYIFDEATASLDSQNEAIVQQHIQNLLDRHIVLTITHRLNTIREANKIIVIHAGKILEIGTHQSLIKSEGAYYELFQHKGEMIDAKL